MTAQILPWFTRCQGFDLGGYLTSFKRKIACWDRQSHNCLDLYNGFIKLSINSYVTDCILFNHQPEADCDNSLGVP